MEEKKSDFGLSEHVFKIYVKYKAWMKTRTGVIMLSSMEGGILEEKIITATLFMKCYAWNKCQKVNNTEYFFVWQISFSQFWLIILSEIIEKSAEIKTFFPSKGVENLMPFSVKHKFKKVNRLDP